jgi:hypothetical protein
MMQAEWTEETRIASRNAQARREHDLAARRCVPTARFPEQQLTCAAAEKVVSRLESVTTTPPDQLRWPLGALDYRRS